MRRRALILAIASLAGICSLCLYARTDRHWSAASATVTAEARAEHRIYLSPRQISQTGASLLWPGPIRSLIAIDRPLRYGEWRWDERAIPPGPVVVRVDLTTQIISVTRGGHEIGTAVIVYGADDSHPTPLGGFPILSKSAHHVSRTYDAPMPYTLRLTADGIALHGSDVRYGRATHGCVGLPLGFARRLFDRVHVGDMVHIARSRGLVQS